MNRLLVRAALLVLVVVTSGCGGGGGSGGAASVSVPNVVGDTQAAATTALTGAGLTLGTVTMQSSSTVASGSVISENPAAGASVASGSAVALVVSSGPAMVAVPNVVGDTQAAATTAITGAGLTVGAVTQQSSATVASGQVISENPAANTSVASGSAVALVISSGPPTHTIGATVIGLGANAVVHVFNGADNVPIAANGSFIFPTAVVSGGSYSVTVGTPTSAQTCAVQNGSGTVASANVTGVVVYCTYNVSDATLNNTFMGVSANFDVPANNMFLILDTVGPTVYDGMGNVSTPSTTVNVGGTIVSAAPASGTYTVSTTDAIPSLTNSVGGSGGIEGLSGDAAVGVGTVSGTPSAAGVGVFPDVNATTDSVNGSYTHVLLLAYVSNGSIEADEGPTTLTNGTFSSTFTSNTGGTIVTGNSGSGTLAVTNGLVTQNGGAQQGAVSADGDLIIMADTQSGDNPNIDVLVHQGTGVTQATFEGVYIVAQYGGLSTSTTFGKAITLFAYGNGTFSITFTKNNNGTVTTNNTDSGTYTVAADGTLTLTDSEGNVYSGAISADGNALVFASVVSGESPAIAAGVRQ
jgi:hypothetical protein